MSEGSPAGWREASDGIPRQHKGPFQIVAVGQKSDDEEKTRLRMEMELEMEPVSVVVVVC